MAAPPQPADRHNKPSPPDTEWTKGTGKRHINISLERSELNCTNGTTTRAVHQRQGAQIAGSQRTTSIDSSPQMASSYTPSDIAKTFCDGIKYTAMSIHRACLGQLPDRKPGTMSPASCIRHSDTSTTVVHTPELSTQGIAIPHSLCPRQTRFVHEAYVQSSSHPQNQVSRGCPVQAHQGTSSSIRANIHLPQKTLSEFVFQHTKLDNEIVPSSTIADSKLSTTSAPPLTHGVLHPVSRESGCPVERYTGRMDEVCSIIKHPTPANTSSATVTNTLTPFNQKRNPSSTILTPASHSGVEAPKPTLAGASTQALKPCEHTHTGAVAESNARGHYTAPTTYMHRYEDGNEHTSVVAARVQLEQPWLPCNPSTTAVDCNEVNARAHGVTPVALNSSEDWYTRNVDPYTLSVQTPNTDTDNTTRNTTPNTTPSGSEHTSIQSSSVASASVVSREPTTSRQPANDTARQSAPAVDLHTQHLLDTIEHTVCMLDSVKEGLCVQVSKLRIYVRI